MREIQVSEAKPEADRRQEEIDQAIAGIPELRKHTGKITLAEILSARDEGRE
ncbi:MAG: hypothetical protein ACLQVN_14495 [Bryobacteraceae bacterium]